MTGKRKRTRREDVNIDWRPFIPKGFVPLNQEQTSTCWAFAIALCLSLLALLEHGMPDDGLWLLSVQELIDRVCQVYDRDDVHRAKSPNPPIFVQDALYTYGSPTTFGFSYCKGFGLTYAHHYPFVGRRNLGKSMPSEDELPRVYIEDFDLILGRASWYMDTILDYLEEQPLVGKLYATMEFCESKSCYWGRDNHIEHETVTTDQVISTVAHAVLIVGYIGKLDCFIILNSWGKDYGNKGYLLVASELMFDVGRPKVSFRATKRLEDRKTNVPRKCQIPEHVITTAGSNPPKVATDLISKKMVSDAGKKKVAQKKAAAAAKRGGKAAAPSKIASSSSTDNLSNGVEAIQISDRTCTGVLCSHPLSRDIFIESLSLTFHGRDLIVDSELELNYGRRYGLLGLNGCGKSTLLESIGRRELPIPEHVDIFHLTREIEASDMSSLQAVLNCDEKLKLEKEAEVLAAQDDGGGEALERIYECLDAMDAATAEKRAAEILFGLGFTKEMQARKTRDFSGGWRMRIALARALFMNPTLLLLDEPTNHLDLEACVWLEEMLKKFDRILVVSHSQDFLNGVCTNIIHMQSKQLKMYTGNFDQYVQIRSEHEENQMKQYKWEQDQIANMKEYIARFGHGSAKLARQAQSKEKTLAKMERGGLTQKVSRDQVLVFRFVDVGKLPPSVLQFVEVSFGYTPDNLIYKNIDFGVDLDSRIALVGPNGAGKSTLLKLMTGDLVPNEGMVRRHNHLSIAQYHQHLKLDLELSALLFMIREFPGNEEEKMRSAIGRFVLTGKAQVMPMKNLSDGQKSSGVEALQISDRTCTGVLCSHPLSRDICIESLSLTFHGRDLIVDSELELNYGRHYGLLGLNGCGKSTLLESIGRRELPIPEHMDIFHLTREIEASDMSSLKAVLNCDEEKLKLEKEAEVLAAQDDGGGEALERIYECLDAMDAATAEKRAAEILFGLGFTKEMQARKTRDFSGGWRMRIALARALFMNPTLLLLDEPTNHLDLEACVWLEEMLKKFDRILVVSHSQDFLNGVCTNIIHMQSKQLKMYTGNFDQYVQIRSEHEENQMKQYKWEQDQISNMKEYIARFGHGSAKLARQAQSKEKTLAKMERGGLTQKVSRDQVLVFRFVDVGKLPPSVLQFVEVSFGYTPDNLIYKNIDFGVDLDPRIALVGPNGAGKSTLLKLMTGDLVPNEGMVRRHNHLCIAQYHQHLKLDLELSALLFMIREFPGNEEEKMRSAIGRFGLTGKAQVMPMKNLSDGQKSSGVEALQISDRTCTGVLCSHPLSRDICIESLSLTFHGRDLIVDSELELNYGRHYGLLGLNGCGKSTLLESIGRRELPIPEHMDIFHLTREIEASDMSSLKAVLNCDEEKLKLEKEAEVLAAQDDGGGEALERIYECLDAMDAATAEKRAAEILFGLGFTKEMQARKTRDFSGGWRMRIALARALFMNPTLLLLDEPTNHLDLEACVWLEEMLKKFDRILVVVSHSQDFLNGVCIIHMQSKQLKMYTGNFDQYVQIRSEHEENQMKQYKWEQDQIANMKEYIARFGHGSAKLARQAQSKEKTLAKMERGGLTQKVSRDQVLVFRFVDVGKLPPSVLQFVEVSFGYTPDNLIYKNIDFGVDLDSRIALVGPNGAAKSTLLKLMTGDLVPNEGMVCRHNHLRIAQYHQHLTEELDLELSALLFMIREFPGNEEEKMRSAIGRFGLTGKAQMDKRVV